MNVYYYALSADDPTSFYRMSGVLPFIHHKDLHFKDISNEHNISWATLSGADVLIIQRPFTTNHANFIKLAKDMNIQVIADYDDDLLNVPESNPTYRMYQDNKESILDCIRHADLVWVSTSSIERSFAQYAKNTLILPNSHNDYMFPVKDKQSFNKKSKLAAYRGGGSHEVDVYDSIGILTYIINNNQDWEFRFIGSSFPYLESLTGDNHTVTEPLTIIQFYKYLHKSNPNLFFYPLKYTKFNEGKSNIALLEATYSGAVFMGNSSLIEFNHQFVLNLSCEFFNEFKDDKNTLRSINNDAWEWVVSERLLSSVNKLRIESLLSFI